MENNKQNAVPIAVVGMECFFPKSSGLKEYWRLIFRGEDAITEIPETHWSANDYYDEDPKKPDHVYCKRGGFLDPLSFDPTEFGIPPAILEATDSSQLLALTAAKAALENAGYLDDSKTFDKENTSVILGVTGTQELVIPLSSRLGHPVWRKALKDAGVDDQTIEDVIERIGASYVSWQENSFPGLLGNVIAGRISNRLDLGGTNCVVDAACASSLGAIHLASLELASGRSSMVVTGGVDTLNDIFMHMCFAKTSVLSPTGDARPFSKEADGTVLGEGVGIVLLKRLADAVKDKDRIYGVIKAMGTSSDGKAQSIYSPRADGQIKALERAYKLADTDPLTIELIEAHGTGTPVGDEIEFTALDRFFKSAGDKTDQPSPYRALGSVKSMIGHTKASAGAAGLIKTVLALYNKVLPPTLKIKEPDPQLGIENSSFYLSDQSRPWFSRPEHPRRAGVSAFGFGGSNFHLVLEEHERNKQQTAWDGSVEILAFSNDSVDKIQGSLVKTSEKLHSAKSFLQVAQVASDLRDSFDHQKDFRLLMVMERSLYEKQGMEGVLSLLDHAGQKLKENPDQPEFENTTTYFGGPEPPGKMAFVFPGQGAQYVGMAGDLICTFPQAFEVMEKANSLFSEKDRLSDFIYPVPAMDRKQKKKQEGNLTKTDFAQPAIGGISLAMLKIMRYFGLSPDAACGHSFGELVALNAAGWIDDQTLLNLAVNRGRLMAAAGKTNQKDPGTMLAVKAPLEELDALLKNSDTGVILANRNSPKQGVLSGPTGAIEKADFLCKEKGYKTVALSVAAAFHSHLMQDAQKPFMETVEKISMTPTSIPVYANSTASPYPTDPAAAQKMLGEQILHHVDFVNSIKNLYASGVKTFVEVGPKTVLTGLIKAILGKEQFHIIPMDASGGRKSNTRDLASALSELAALGYPVTLKNWESGGTPPPGSKKQKMQVMISGANYRSAQIAKPMPKSKARPVDFKNQGPEEKASENQAAPHNPDTIQHVEVDKTESMKDDSTQPDFNHKGFGQNKPGPVSDNSNSTTSQDSNILVHALAVIQEGLNSMQALQKQTAETHQKFLDTQAQANQTLQNMMENTRQMIFGKDPASHPADTAYAQTNTIKTPDNLSASSSASLETKDPLPAPTQKPLDDMPDKRGVPDQDTFQTKEDSPTTAVLLETVSDLTGYPQEMLDLDMDIESDLGIDSIKRVEILSTMEEKISGLPPVEPEIMGSLKTLNQIIQYLSPKTEARARPETGSVFKTGSSTAENTHTDNNDVTTVLLATVSDLTGYPQEMLDLDMDIESDLGIDSIKRVEILSTMEEKISGLPPVEPEIMGSLKTLNQIIQYLNPVKDKLSVEPSHEALTKAREAAISEPEKNTRHFSKKKEIINRQVVSLAPAPLDKKSFISLPPGKKIYVIDTNTPLSQAIVDELVSRNLNAELIPLDFAPSDKILSDTAGLVIPARMQITSDTEKSENLKQGTDFLEKALMAAKTFAPALMASAIQGGAVFAGISFMDGGFGLKNPDIDDPLMGGIAGLVKTAAIEWHGVTCRCLDVSSAWDQYAKTVKAIADELLYADPAGPTEVGLFYDSRYTLHLKSGQCPAGKLNLAAHDVVAITGGARGITAAAAQALANQLPLNFILLGRSPEPFSEPQWLEGVTDEKKMKKAIMANEFSGKKASLQAVEKKYKTYSANREILNNLNALKSLGSDAVYFSVDIKNPEKVKTIVENVHSSYGNISAVIHGAGVLEDKLIVDKTPEQFKNVFETKIKGLFNLLDATPNDPLKYLVFFSSVAARMGNKGQADYAMANEALNKIALKQAHTRKDCKVLSINWGPWDGGMVSLALKKEFEKNNIGLIPIDQGTQSLIEEMKADHSQPVEVVLGSIIEKPPCAKHPIADSLKPPTCPKTASKLSMAFQRDVNIDEYPVLNSHILGGTPVVPFALMAEWCGHGALHANPGLMLQGLDDMRVLKGIQVNQNKPKIRILTGKVKRNNAEYEVDVEIRNGIPHEQEVVHSRVKAILTEALAHPPVFIPPVFMGSNGYSRTIHEIYEKILFHGYDLQGMKEVTSLTDQGMVAQIRSAPPPAKWMKKPLRNRWIGDPLVLDSAFQMASLWCYEKLGSVSLPVYSAAYRQYRHQFPKESLTAVLEVSETSQHKMKGNFTFLDSQQTIVAQITGYEAVVDESLNKAFKQ